MRMLRIGRHNMTAFIIRKASMKHFHQYTNFLSISIFSRWSRRGIHKAHRRTSFSCNRVRQRRNKTMLNRHWWNYISIFIFEALCVIMFRALLSGHIKFWTSHVSRMAQQSLIQASHCPIFRMSLIFHTVQAISRHTIPYHTTIHHNTLHLSLIHIWRCRRRG